MRMIAICSILLVIPASARADAVAAPPDDCPVGALGETSHAGTWCAPTTCTSDATCEAQHGGWGGEVRTLVCRPAGLCVRSEQYDPGGLRAEGEVVRLTRTVVEGACGGDADCTGSARCEVTPRCVSPSLPELVAHRAGCGCAIAPRSRSVAGVLLLLAAGLGLGARARRRRQLGGAGTRAPSTRS